ncbi:MAG: transferrin receptor-like dimerization domain-containing protein [Gemmatimonadales bacterium]
MADHLDLSWVRRGVEAWRRAADALAVRQASARGPAAARLNEALRAIEQQWVLADGIPGRPWFRHALYAPKSTYAAMELPGVREAVDQGDWAGAARELDRLAERLEAVVAATEQAGN